jgi:hypothetical protein
VSTTAAKATYRAPGAACGFSPARPPARRRTHRLLVAFGARPRAPAADTHHSNRFARADRDEHALPPRPAPLLGACRSRARGLAETSADFHAAVASALTASCAEHPARVLCVYDRPGAGTAHLGLAVTHHRGGLQEQLLTIRDTADRTPWTARST